MRKIFALTALLVCLLFAFSSCSAVYNMESGMNTLTSDQMAGRQAGSQGGAAAAKYIQDTFTELGVQQYVQSFHYQTYAPDQLKVSLIITRSGGAPTESVLGTDYMPTRISKTADVKGGITFDRNDANLKDKILVTDKLFSLREASQKPKGILLLEDPLVKRVEARDTSLPVFSISKRLFEVLASGVTTQAEMSIQSTIQPSPLQNIIGVLPGKNREEAVVLSAHFDGCGFDSCGIYKGAVDNASGVVTMLKCAQILKDSFAGSAPSVDIVFAAFDGEENGLIGSQYFMQQSDYKKVTNINMDCLGKGSIYIQADENNAELAKAISKSVAGSQVIELGGVSDNMVFSFYDYPAVMITTLKNSYSGDIHTLKDTNDSVDRMLLLKLANDLSNYIAQKCGAINKPLQSATASASKPIVTSAPSASQSAAATAINPAA
ncbi:MAG: M28 family metallopeptidase [Eubacteriales bacterium]